MKQEWRDAVEAMREAGFAVIYWTPFELEKANAEQVERWTYEASDEIIVEMNAYAKWEEESYEQGVNKGVEELRELFDKDKVDALSTKGDEDVAKG